VFVLFLLREKHKKINIILICTCVVTVVVVQNWSIGRSNGGRTMIFYSEM